MINEILYSPSTKQWVEVYNNTDSSVDLSQYKILDAGAATNGHSIMAAQSGGSTVLPPGSYGVIAKDVTSVSASYLFRASLGIKTTGDTVTLKKGTSVIDTTSFSDIADSGNTLQRFDSGWSQSSPTPGAVNALISQDASGSGSQATSTVTTTDSSADGASQQSSSVAYSAHYYFVPSQNEAKVAFSLSAGRDRLGTVGEELLFKALLNTNDPNTSFFWNFGDGTTAEGRETKHAYELPGDYNVVLNAALFDNRAVSRIRVKVIDPDLRIVEANDTFIAVKNSAKYEINLYGWEFRNGTRKFDFPMDTIIGAGETVRFPSSVTKLGPPVQLGRKEERSTSALISPSLDVAAAPAISTTPREKDIQALADRLVALNLQLFALQNPTSSQTAVTDTQEPVPAAASAIESSSPTATTSNSWMTIVKHFFLR